MQQLCLMLFAEITGVLLQRKNTKQSKLELIVQIIGKLNATPEIQLQQWKTFKEENSLRRDICTFLGYDFVHLRPMGDNDREDGLNL